MRAAGACSLAVVTACTALPTLPENAEARDTSQRVRIEGAHGPLSVDALQYIVREAGSAAKLDVAVHPHMLRHATGYSLANDGTDTRLIQAFLGHADIRHTAHYTAISPRRLAGVRVR